MLTVNPILPGGALTFATFGNATQWPSSSSTPFTYTLRILATDAAYGTTASGIANVSVISIIPRAASGVTTALAANAGVGTLVTTLYPTFVATSYSATTLRYVLTVVDPTFEGDAPTFSVDPVTGSISVATAAYAEGGSGPPRWNVNTKTTYSITYTVTDLSNGRSATATISVPLRHVNRAPAWTTTPPALTTPAQTLVSAVGSPLSSYVTDLDTALGIGERLTFSITAGNDGTFAINNASGALSVVDKTKPSFVYPGSYSLTVLVVDAGIDGSQLSASVTVTVTLIPTTEPPNVTSGSFTVQEHALDGFVVGRVNGSSIVATTPLTYAITPAGANVNNPFPFGIRTVPVAGRNGYGEIYVVSSGGPINFSPWKGTGMFSSYAMTVTVTDARLGAASLLTASAPVSITVTWVPEPPFFNPAVTPPAYLPGSFATSLYIRESSAAGTNASASSDGFSSGTAFVSASTKDPFLQRNLVFSIASSTPAASSAVFSVDARSGAVYARTAVPALTAAASYLLVLRVTVVGATTPYTSASGLTDTANVTVRIVQINNPAVWTGVGNGLFNAAGVSRTGPSPPNVTFSENLVGVVARLSATDANPSSTLWGQKIYSLASTPGSTDFLISSNTGVLSVAASLSYTARSVYDLIAIVTDADPVANISVPFPFRVYLTQQNRIVITNVTVSLAEVVALRAVNVPGSSYAAAFPSHAVLLSTSGATVLVNGSGFGTPAYAQFGSQTRGPACTVIVTGAYLSCPIPAGTGSALTLTITAGSYSASAPTTLLVGFFPPLVTSVTRQGYSLASQQILPTSGLGENILVTGQQLGPAGTSPLLTYGAPSAPSRYLNARCNVTIAQTTAVCVPLAGIGGNFSFVLSVGGTASPPFASILRYAPPTITGFTASASISTSGGNVLTVTGMNFGPPTSAPADVSLTYGGAPFVATGCNVPLSSPHTTLICYSAAGVGRLLGISVTVGGQTVTSASFSVSYAAPTVSALYGPGTALVETTGGVTIGILGTNFGPIDSRFSPNASYTRAGSQVYAALSCRTTVAHTNIECVIAEGTGTGYSWTVVVGGQTSAACAACVKTGYRPPVAASFTGAGADQASTPGFQAVRITGSGFGPLSTPPSLISGYYGLYNVDNSGVVSDDFNATGCNVTVAHYEITCFTNAGAGTSLQWVLVVDGQRSTQETTNYAQPSISAITALDASVTADALNPRGGQNVLLSGLNFAEPRFLEAVSYGPTGYEYVAQNCVTVTPHFGIRCTTIPGIGTGHVWLVTVRGQVSARSASTTSYSAPSIVALSETRFGTISSSVSPVVVTLVTQNLPIGSPAFTVFVQVGDANALSLVSVPILRSLAPVLPSGVSGIAAATNADGSVNISIALPSSNWITALPPTSDCLLTDGWAYGDGAQNTACMVPDIAGAQVGLRLLVLPAALADVNNATLALARLVGAVSAATPVAALSFFDPKVSSVVISMPPWLSNPNVSCPLVSAAPTWTCESPLIYKLEISGANFGGAAPGLTRQLFSCDLDALGLNPMCNSLADWGSGAQPGLPLGNGPRNDAAQLWVDTWTHTSIIAYTTRSAGALMVSLSSSGVTATSTFTQTAIATFQNLAPSIISILGAEAPFPTAGDSTRIVTIQVVELAGAASISVTVGGALAALCDSTGAPVASTAAMGVPVISSVGPVWSVYFRVPPGQGLRVPVIITRQLGAFVTPSDSRATVDYIAPVLVSARVFDSSGASFVDTAVGGGSAAFNVSTNGNIVELRGTNLGTSPSVTLQQFSASAAGSVVTQTITLAGGAVSSCGSVGSCWSVAVPPGEGGQWTLTLEAGNQASAPAPWTFTPPTVSNVAAAGPLAHGFSTQGGDTIILQGFNFGRVAATTGSPPNSTYSPSTFAAIAAPAVSLGLPSDPLSAWFSCTNVARLGPDVLSCVLPEGAGSGLSIAIVVGDLVGISPNAISYGSPLVAGLSSSVGAALNATAWEVALSGMQLPVTPLGPTAGGALVTITGFNFGRASPSNCAFFTWAQRAAKDVLLSAAPDVHVCDGGEGWLGEGEIDVSYVRSWTHTSIVLAVPPGIGQKELQIVVKGAALQPPRTTLNNFTSPSVPRLQYASPNVVSLNSWSPVDPLPPASVSTAGGDVLVLNGTNFGPPVFNTSILANTLPPFGATLFSTPLPLLCVPGATMPCAPSLPLAYPVVLFHRGCAAFPFDTLGRRRTDLTVQTFFSVAPLYANDATTQQCAASIVSISDTRIVFVSMPGVGVDRNVSLAVVSSVGNQVVASPPARFSYLPPLVTGFSPNVVRMRTTSTAPPTLITMVGSNFGDPLLATAQGWSDTELALAGAIGGASCAPMARGLDAMTGAPNLVCTIDASRSAAGFANVTVLVAGQTGKVAPGAYLLLVCDTGFYGRMGESCLPCPAGNANPALSGAVCDGYREWLPVLSDRFAYPRPLPGWFNLNSTDSFTQSLDTAAGRARGSTSMIGSCPTGFQDAGRDVCIVPCEPASSCVGDNFCAFGYASKPPMFRCASCAAGFYKSANQCIKCPDSPAAVIVVVALVIVLLIAAGYWLNKRQINLAVISIGVDFFQVLAIFAQSNVRWPPQVLALMQVLSAFNFNIEIVAPECLVPDVTFKQKFAFIMLLPLAVCGLLYVFFLVHAFNKRCVRGQRDKRKIFSHRKTAVSSAIVLFYLLYLYLTRTVFNVFSCTPTTPPDGKLYLTVVFEECGIPGGTQLTLLPFALGGLGFYALGFPAWIGRLLYHNRELVMEDQYLRAKGVGHDRLTNPHALDFRQTFGRTYFQFRPEWCMWILAIFARKFCIAVTAVIFSGSVTFQMAACLLIMFLAYAAQVQIKPYMSPTDAESVLKSLDKASLDGSLMHARIKTAIDVIESRGRKIKVPRILEVNGRVNRTAIAAAVTAYLFNYNTVEATMSFCAVLVCLAGLMYQAQSTVAGTQDSITALLMLTIIGAILYFASAVGLEIYTGVNDAAVAARERAAAKRKRGGMVLSNASNVDRDDGKLDSQVNPLFLSRDGGLNVGADVDSLVASILAQKEVPPLQLWTVFKEQFASVAGRLKETTDSAAAMKKELQQFEVMRSALTASNVQAATKKSFGPSRREDSAGGGSGAGGGLRGALSTVARGISSYRSAVSRGVDDSPSSADGAGRNKDQPAFTENPLRLRTLPTSPSADAGADAGAVAAADEESTTAGVKRAQAAAPPAPSAAAPLAPSSAPAAAQLPPGWSSRLSRSTGKTMYFSESGETAWEPEQIPGFAEWSARHSNLVENPLRARDATPQPAVLPVEEGLPPGWASKISSKSGKKFYFNGFTRQTAWALEEIPGYTK